MLRVAAFRGFVVLNCSMELALKNCSLQLCIVYSNAKAMPGGTVPSENITPISSGKFIAALTKFSFYLK